MTPDNDSIRRMTVRSVPAPKPSTPAAERARRYRARKRGEKVPKRKPGPKPTARGQREWLLKQEKADLQRQLDGARFHLQQARDRLAARTRPPTLEQMCRELLAYVGRTSAEVDAPATRELLRDVYAALDARHDSWAGT